MNRSNVLRFSVGLLEAVASTALAFSLSTSIAFAGPLQFLKSASPVATNCASGAFQPSEARVNEVFTQFSDRWTQTAPGVVQYLKPIVESAQKNGWSKEKILSEVSALQVVLLQSIGPVYGLSAAIHRLTGRLTTTEILLRNETILYRRAQLETDLLALAELVGLDEPIPTSALNPPLGFFSRLSRPARKQLETYMQDNHQALWSKTVAASKLILKGSTSTAQFLSALVGNDAVNSTTYINPMKTSLAGDLRSAIETRPMTTREWHALQNSQLKLATMGILSEIEPEQQTQLSRQSRPLLSMHAKQRIHYVQTLVKKVFLTALTVGFVLAMGTLAITGGALGQNYLEEKRVEKKYEPYSHAQLVEAYQVLLVMKWQQSGALDGVETYTEDQARDLALAAEITPPDLRRRIDTLKKELDVDINTLIGTAAFPIANSN